MATVAPYGTWKSPISASLLIENAIKFEETHVDPVTSHIYWVESRPSEGARSVPVLANDGNVQDVIPDGEWSVRTKVHGYGGAAVAVRDNVLYFSDLKTGRIFRADATKRGDHPVPVTPDNVRYLFGDLAIHPTYPHILFSILEDHTNGSHAADVVNTLVAVNTKTQTIKTLVSGADFYSSPAVSPDGSKLAFVSWNHPHMPWETSQLFVSPLSFSGEDIELSEPPKAIAGGEDTSVSEPRWADPRTLIFLWDATGFYNPYVFDALTLTTKELLAKPQPNDFADPAWSLGESHYTILNPTSLLAAPIIESVSVLTLIDIPTGVAKPLSSNYVSISRLKTVSFTEAVFIGKGYTTDRQIVKVKLDTNGDATPPRASFSVLKQSSKVFDSLPPGLISSGLPLVLPPEEGKEGDGPLHVLYTPPQNPGHRAPEGELPPAVVYIHGGPTHRDAPGLNELAQLFTSRGWAYVSVNYGGSSGYGRAYRSRLNGNWGIVDVADSVTAVRRLGARGLIDPKRLAIRGGSAGGYTVLATLVTHPSVFSAGTSAYGVSDLLALVEDTHKFESRYMLSLIGGGTPEETRNICKKRSPVHYAENIKAPLLILQGDADTIVPPNQAELMIEKIKANGGKYKYVLFEGEGHGWRKSENIRKAFETELAWYEEIFGLGSPE